MPGLGERDLVTLLAGVTVERVAGQLSVPVEYGGYSSNTFLRMHLLPYLIPIRSERQLAFAVAEKEALRRCIGLRGDQSPQRGSLWHFRKRNVDTFRHLLVRGLTTIYIDASPSAAALPFVRQMSPFEGREIVDSFEDPESQTSVELSYPSAARLVSREMQLSLGFEESVRSGLELAGRVYLPDEIGFPVFARLEGACIAASENSAVFGEPTWLREPYRRMDIEQFGRGSREPYTACNVVVTRLIDGEEHILLSKRVQGAGRGSYTLPGGKRGPGESLYACAARELKEETGLVLKSAKPISLRRTRRKGYPAVTSIGVIGSAPGEPRRREHHQHASWKWYKRRELPKPLFFPTKLVLDDLEAERFPDLTWDEIEDQDELPLWRNE